MRMELLSMKLKSLYLKELHLIPWNFDRFVGPASEITIPGGVRTIDATGRMIIPGGIDPHTNMQRLQGDTVAVDE